ncbi:STM4012 family radical SAM protein [Entomomonas asaccharolytica]|uniref:STM4012 family radical SAM protein n=1 Tax=Entomomonas asaccharolytica TaxID=2785331 RepID=A0A974RXB2_9GAMM|nr:STM4012 family radical SAM protein [Entomomonas asaccharolytica]QQP86002.1 STM4012 family radical SAM protein [Entomomonas asaccharolytica]
MSLQALIEQGEYYKGYTYAYPHKTSYRHFEPISLESAWSVEDKSQLFLYAHIPFCGMRCGFCNLFTTANPKLTLTKAYIEALTIQAKVTYEALGEQARFSRFALGGGTPTYLLAEELQLLFDALAVFKLDYAAIPSSVETSPATVTLDRLAILKNYHIKRISMGVQSFSETEIKSVGRGQSNQEVIQAIEKIRKFDFPLLNLDLIYGLAHQDPKSWAKSLQTTLSFEPEEIFLYPLYVRPLTGIGKFGFSWDDERLRLYQQGRDTLLNAGYEQISMRYFRKPMVNQIEPADYCCQQDGMVGLGCGARSYTRELHYSNEYAVGRKGIKAILESYNSRTEADFKQISYGFKMDEDTQKRRFILQSILHMSGLSIELYQKCFASSPFTDYPQLAKLVALQLIEDKQSCWKLTQRGLELADLIGPWFYAPDIEQRMNSYQLV